MLDRLASQAVSLADRFAAGVTGTAEQRRAELLDVVPAIVDYYTDGSAALAADFYDDARERAGAAGAFRSEPVVADRTVKIRRGVAWAAEPWVQAAAGVIAVGSVSERLAEVVSIEIARPYRDTITANRRRDPQSVGWRRITAPGACGFCMMLADKGAIYKQETARFAAHNSCMCTAEPVFRGQAVGPEASVLQYTASKRKRTEAEKADIRYWVKQYESRGATWYSDYLRDLRAA